MKKKLNLLFGKRDKKFAYLLIILATLVAFAETLSITAVMPFVAMVSDTAIIDQNTYLNAVYNDLGFKDKVNFIVVSGVLLVVFFLFKGLMNVSFFHLLARFAKGRAHKLACRLFAHYLHMPYRTFVEQNSSQMAKNITHETEYLGFIFSTGLLMFSEILVMLGIGVLMVWVDWQLTLMIATFITLTGGLLLPKVSKKIKQQGELKEQFQRTFCEIINSTLANFKTIKLHLNQKDNAQRFNQASEGFASAYIAYETFSHIPRLFLEIAAFGLIVLMSLYFLYAVENDLASFVGTLSLFAMGLYRLMPCANRIIAGYNQIQYYHKSVDLVSESLLGPVEKLGHQPIDFKQTLALKNVSFAYTAGHPILKNITLTIAKGEKIAFIGESGGGKTTLVDLIIGLHRIDSGEFLIDDQPIDNSTLKAWRQKIGYIAQDVYLFDGTVAENVALNKHYEQQQVKTVLAQAKMLDFLVNHQNGLQTFVGEGGVKLSGGQKQRIAIARALYNNPEVLVLDEATSALDQAIENQIMQAIYEISANKTLIIIAHRLSTISQCDKVFRVKDRTVYLEKASASSYQT